MIIRFKEFLFKSNETYQRVKRTLLQLTAGTAVSSMIAAIFDSWDAFRIAVGIFLGTLVSAYAQNSMADRKAKKTGKDPRKSSGQEDKPDV